MAAPFLSATELRARLAPLIDDHPGGTLAFDADGTLWSHDAGCMVFEAAYEQDILRPAALEPLRDEAHRARVQIEDDWSLAEIARALESAFLAGTYNERSAAEMQVWAYIDFTVDELRELCRQTFADGRHEAGLHREVFALADWARARGAKTRIVSASPRIVIEEAIAGLGFEKSDVAAGDPNMNGSLIAEGMRAPLPYGPDKVIAGRELLDGGPWLAAFGDSNFDLEMMGESKLAVGIGNKPSMLAGLDQHPAGVRFEMGTST